MGFSKDVLVNIAILAVVIFIGQMIANWGTKKLEGEGAQQWLRTGQGMSKFSLEDSSGFSV